MRTCQAWRVRLAAWTLVCAIPGCWPAARAETWDFDSGAQGWIAVPGMTVAVQATADASAGGSLRISGVESGSWIYTRATTAAAVQAGKGGDAHEKRWDEPLSFEQHVEERDVIVPSPAQRGDREGANVYR